MRDSPALNVAGQIQLQGATVTVYDPKAMENSRRLFPTLGYATSIVEAVEGADVVLVLTEWQEFREMRPSKLARAVRRHNIIDGRNVCNRPSGVMRDGSIEAWPMTIFHVSLDIVRGA